MKRIRKISILMFVVISTALPAKLVAQEHEEKAIPPDQSEVDLFNYNSQEQSWELSELTPIQQTDESEIQEMWQRATLLFNEAKPNLAHVTEKVSYEILASNQEKLLLSSAFTGDIAFADETFDEARKIEITEEPVTVNEIGNEITHYHLWYDPTSFELLLVCKVAEYRVFNLYTLKKTYIKRGNNGSGEQIGLPQELVDVHELSCYPNPASDLMNVSFQLPEEAAVSLYVVDLTGKRFPVLDKKNYSSGNQMIPVEVSQLSAGTYLMTLEIDQKQFTKRFMVTTGEK